ncbi:MAG: xanthine dehydrogenase accessory factor [Actinomycetota bacterium]|nr:xanthine dehydrogenase accessory factor [Actinomycetota bacterium]
MFDIADQVIAWLADQRPVWLARVVTAAGMGSGTPAEAAAYVHGEWRTGTLLFGAVDAQLRDALGSATADGRAVVVDLLVGDTEAHAAGLTCGGAARILLQPAADVPAEAWQLLAARAPVCLVTEMTGPTAGRTTWLDSSSSPGDPAERMAERPEVRRLFGRGTQEATVLDVDGSPVLIASLWPTPRLVVVGDGLIADALEAAARLMRWEPSVVTAAAAAAAAVEQLGPGDGVIVLSHDRSVDAPVLAAALGGRAGYVAALGSRRTQAARADWLTEHGVATSDIERVHGPAGLDIGARTPEEITVSIIAEMVAIRAGTTGRPLVAGDGPIHPDGLHAPPARYPTRTP